MKEANVSFDHPLNAQLDHALNIDFVNHDLGLEKRVAVELSAASARRLIAAIEEALRRGAEEEGLGHALGSAARRGRERGAGRGERPAPFVRRRWIGVDFAEQMCRIERGVGLGHSRSVTPCPKWRVGD